MCYYSEGGFTQDILYSMPVYLRNFYYNKLAEAKSKEKEQYDKVSKSPNSGKTVAKPPI